MERKYVLLYPKATEKTGRMVESENKLTFVVSDKSTKAEIKREFEEKYKARVIEVNVFRSMKGKKLAYIKLEEPGKASELAMRLKML